MSALLTLTTNWIQQVWPFAATNARRRRTYTEELERIHDKNVEFLARLTTLDDHQQTILSELERLFHD